MPEWTLRQQRVPLLRSSMGGGDPSRLEETGPRGRWSPQRLTLWIAALPLVASAALKLAAGPNALDLSLAAGLFGFAAWISLTHLRTLALGITAGLYLSFAIYNFIQGINGNSDCGCFGEVQLSPWWTMAGDLVLSIGLGIAVIGSRVRFAARFAPYQSKLAFVAAVAGATLLLSPVALAMTPDHRSDDLDWLDEIQTSEAIDQGNWELVLVLRGCEKCDRFVANLPSHQNGRRRMVVEMASAPSTNDQILNQIRADAYGWLSLESSVDLDRFPSTVHLVDGRIIVR